MPSAATGKSPATAMFGHPLQTWLGLIQDLVSQTHEKEEASSKRFTESTPVWMHSFDHSLPWIAGNVLCLV